MNKSRVFKIEDILGQIFEQREEEIYNFTAEEIEKNAKKSQDYDSMYIAINNIPDAFTETTEGIKTSIENYLESLNDLQGIENKKFYQEGFSDAINLILNCVNKGIKNYSLL